MALQYLEAGNILNCFKTLLKYYDKYYLKCLDQKKDPVAFIKKIALENTDAIRNAETLEAIVCEKELVANGQ